MNTHPDLLYEAELTPNYKPFVKKIISKVYIFQILLSLIVLFISLRTTNYDIGTVFGSKINFILFALERLLPFVAVVLFIYRKKIGWILVATLSFVDFFFKGAFLARVLGNINEYLSDPFFLILHFTLFLFASIVPILLFNNSVLGIFAITNKSKIVSISLAILYFLAIKFQVADLITKI